MESNTQHEFNELVIQHVGRQRRRNLATSTVLVLNTIAVVILAIKEFFA